MAEDGQVKPTETQTWVLTDVGTPDCEAVLHEKTCPDVPPAHLLTTR